MVSVVSLPDGRLAIPLERCIVDRLLLQVNDDVDVAVVGDVIEANKRNRYMDMTLDELAANLEPYSLRR